MRTYLLPLIIAITIFSPAIDIFPRLPAFKIEDFFILVILIQSFITKKKKNKFYIENDSISKPLLFIGYIAIFSVILQELFFSKVIILNDLMIFPQIIKYWIIIQFAKSIRQDKNALKFCLYTLFFSGFINAIIGIFQYHNFLNINNWLTPFYAARYGRISENISLNLLINQHDMARSIGTIGDPRYFGYLLNCCLGIGISFLLHSKNRKTKILSIIVLFFLFWASIYSLSRTAVISLLLIIGISSYIFLSYSKNLSRLFKYLFVIVTLLFLSKSFITQGFEKRILSTDTVSFEKSRHARVRDFTRPFKESSENPIILIFGKGPSKEYMRASAHGDFGWFFLRYGFVSMIIYLILILKGISYSLKNYRSSNFNFYKIVYFTSFIICINWFFSTFTDNIFRQIPLMIVTLSFLGFLNIRKVLNK